MTDFALPMPGPVKGDCEGNQDACTLAKDGTCPLFGTLGRAGRDGNRRVRGCGDPAARGKRNRQKGDSKARRTRKNLGLVGANTRHEEHLGGPVRVENKAGFQVKPIWTRYLAARAQSEAARPIGDNRPFVFVACPDGTRQELYVIRSDDMEAVVFAMAEAWGYGGETA